MRRWVPLGGWPAPASVLQDLGLLDRSDALPFDTVHATWDGVIHFTASGSLEAYFPRAARNGYVRPDPVGKDTLVFRGWHTCFTHCDVNNRDTRAELERRCAAWQRLMSPKASTTGVTPVTFLRSVVATDPLQELKRIPEFHAAVRARTQDTLPFRSVVVILAAASDETAPSGTKPAQPVCVLTDPRHPSVVWRLPPQQGAPRGSPPPAERQHYNGAAANTETAGDGVVPSAAAGDDSSGSNVSLLADACHAGLQHVITTMSKEIKWRQLEGALPSLSSYLASVKPPHNGSLSRLHGVPLFRGTCEGIGSVASAEAGACVHCGCTDGHAATGQSAHSSGRRWQEVEEDELLLAYAMHEGDEVLAAESFAKAASRTAGESHRKLRQLLSEETESEGEEEEGDRTVGGKPFAADRWGASDAGGVGG